MQQYEAFGKRLDPRAWWISRHRNALYAIGFLIYGIGTAFILFEP